jgi:hypothetical protein
MHRANYSLLKGDTLKTLELVFQSLQKILERAKTVWKGGDRYDIGEGNKSSKRTHLLERGM